MAECEKLRVAKEFLQSNNWPVHFRNPTANRCYCDMCYSPSSHDTFVVGGHTYVIPRGWTRLGVYVDEPFAKHHDVWKTWANCFHGTSIENAKSIVEHRQLLLPRDMTLDGKKLQIREGHIPGEYFFFTTPTIRYAALDCYAHTYNFKSSKTNKRYKIKVALQCKQKPNSFIIQPETVGARKLKQQICPHVSNDEIEWKTQNRAAIMPYGLMLQVKDDYEDDSDSDSDSQTNDLDEIKNYTTTIRKPQTIACPHCTAPNLWEHGDYVEGRVVTCANHHCRRKFQEVTCPHCFGSNTWKNADYIEGHIIICAYEKCKKKFQQVSCRHCSGSVIWKSADRQINGVYWCPYRSCGKRL